jgi:photosystem II stability/assembly factor-like uncharacterized protein
MQVKRALPLVLLALALGGCSKRSDPVVSDLWPTWPDSAVPDSVVPDLTPDCPTHTLGDAAGEMGWQVVHVADVPLRAVSCVENHVFAAGDQGTLLHREPGSALCGGFAKKDVPTTADLLTVAFADLNYGVTAGLDPQIWETHDAGETWGVADQCGSVVFSAFHTLHLHSATQGYGAGAVAESPDGAYKVYPGLKWICPGQTFAGQVLYGTFRQENDGWFVGDTKGRIYHTPDEGFTWFYTDTDTTKILRSVAITSAGVGVAVGDDGAILRSEDNLTWSKVLTLGNNDLTDVFFFDDTRGWIVGQNGTVMHTEDSGKTWTYQLVPTAERLQGVCFTSATGGWAVGEGGSILATTTGGL